MAVTSRELVLQTLEFRNPERAPRQMWVLPWAQDHYPEMIEKVNSEFPSDFDGAPGYQKSHPPTVGDPYEVGEYVDEWGCMFTNYHKGVIGEVKRPLIADEEWEDADNVRFPEEWLQIDPEKINAYCAASDKFVMAGCCPRPFERLQFIRGTENLYMDLMMKPKGMMEFIDKLHDFYCRQLQGWAETDVDALGMMDDWGAQQSLLINPALWEEIFMPMYKDYIDIAHKAGKKMFMHSDGYIVDIIPKLIDLGLDAINSQLFCMGFDKLAPFKGKITFWGEIDRQHLLPFATPEEITDAVKQVKENLWHNGGCIAQCEFGPGAKPDNVYAVYDTWDKLKG